MDLFELAAKITLDTKDYEKGLSDASEKGNKFANGLKNAGKVAGVAFGAVTAAVGAASAAISNGVKNTAAYADNIDKMSQKLGMSAKAYQEWDFIAQHSGTSVEGLQASMKTLSVAAESGKDSFERLGLSLSDVQSMSQEDLFSAVITQLQGMEEGTERTALASELLGRSATELAPLLNTSAEATEEMRHQAHELGGVLSDDAVKAGAAFQDSLQNLQTAFSGLKNGLMGDFMPAITDVMDGITALVTGDDTGIDLINKGVESFLQKMIDSIPKIADSAIKIMQSFIDVIVQNLPQIIESGITIVSKLVEGLLQAIPTILMNVPAIVEAIVRGFANALPEFLEVGKNVVKGVWEGIKSMASWIKEKVSGFFNGVVDNVKSVLGIHSPSRVFAGIGENMALGLGKGWDSEYNDIKNGIESGLDFNTDSVNVASTTSAGNSGFAGAFANAAQEIVLNITETIDGAVLARNQYRYNVAEASRHGASLVVG